MIVPLAYGKTGLEFELNDDMNFQILRPRFIPGVENPLNALTRGLRSPIASSPLGEFIQSDDRVGIIVNDITRATPNELILTAILAELGHIPRENITLFIALGTHRKNKPDELKEILGDIYARGYRIVQNDAFDRSTQVCLGTTHRGNEIWINKELMACTIKILTGFIEPHFFAGFSGGGKAIMPGMAGQATVLGNHSVENIAHPNATWGINNENPIWEEIVEIGLVAGKTFLVNVTLNRHLEITDVFTGDLERAHQTGCEFVRQTAMIAVEKPFDIAITTNSGYPLDQNLYQAVKGMSAAAQVVRVGGAIIVTAECRDGIPDHGLYGQLLREAGSPLALLERIRQPGFIKQDQWQVQIQAQIQLKADVYIHSGGLSDKQIRAALLIPAPNLKETFAELIQQYGEDARICILPEGPQTIPYLKTI